MDSLYHAKLSAKKYGGKVEDYTAIHDFIDSSKIVMPDHRHRSLLHSTWGIGLAAKVFGVFIVNSEGKEVPVKEIVQNHILEDLGFLPTAEIWLRNMQYQEWMSGTVKKTSKGKREIPLKDEN